MRQSLREVGRPAVVRVHLEVVRAEDLFEAAGVAAQATARRHGQACVAELVAADDAAADRLAVDQHRRADGPVAQRHQQDVAVDLRLVAHHPADRHRLKVVVQKHRPPPRRLVQRIERHRPRAARRRAQQQRLTLPVDEPRRAQPHRQHPLIERFGHQLRRDAHHVRPARLPDARPRPADRPAGSAALPTHGRPPATRPARTAPPGRSPAAPRGRPGPLGTAAHSRTVPSRTSRSASSVTVLGRSPSRPCSSCRLSGPPRRSSASSRCPRGSSSSIGFTMSDTSHKAGACQAPARGLPAPGVAFPPSPSPPETNPCGLITPMILSNPAAFNTPSPRPSP